MDPNILCLSTRILLEFLPDPIFGVIISVKGTGIKRTNYHVSGLFLKMLAMVDREYPGSSVIDNHGELLYKLSYENNSHFSTCRTSDLRVSNKELTMINRHTGKLILGKGFSPDFSYEEWERVASWILSRKQIQLDPDDYEVAVNPILVHRGFVQKGINSSTMNLTFID